jgi:DNA-binding HxlR family transcriptional regulator
VKPEQGYALSALGRELLAQLLPLTIWAEKWAKQVIPK